MEKTVQVMEVSLNLIDDKGLAKKVHEYLTNDYLNVILLASQQLLLRAAEDSGFREMLERADLILPGEEALLSFHHSEALKEGGMIVNYHCLEKLLTDFQGEKEEVYAVVEKAEHIPFIEGFFKMFRSDMVLVGSIIKPETTDESIVNEINSLAPDVLLIDLPSTEQEEWIMAHNTQLNAKLCVGLGGVMEQMIVEYREEPAIISKLHLSGFYNHVVRKNRYKRAKRERIFRHKLREYAKMREGNKDENKSE